MSKVPYFTLVQASFLYNYVIFLILVFSPLKRVNEPSFSFSFLNSFSVKLKMSHEQFFV